ELGNDDPAPAHGSEEFAEPHLQKRVLTLLVAERRLRAAIVVARQEDGLVWEPSEALRETPVHLARVAAWQVSAATCLDEERVTRDEPAVDQEALRAGCVAGRVDEYDREPPDREVHRALHLHQVGAEAAQKLTLGLVDVD